MGLGNNYKCDGQMSIFDFIPKVVEHRHTCHDCYFLRGTADIPLEKKINGPVCRQLKKKCVGGSEWRPQKQTWDEYLEQDLKRGSGFSGGKRRIIEMYDSSMNQQERIRALKKEYGVGGGWCGTVENSYIFGGDHSGDGLKVIIKTELDGWEEHKFTWRQVDEKLQELIFSGRYEEEKD